MLNRGGLSLLSACCYYSLGCCWPSLQTLYAPVLCPPGPPSPFPQSCFPTTLPVLLHRVLPSKVQDLAFVPVEFCKVSAGPLLHPLQIQLDDSSALENIDWSPSLGSAVNLRSKQCITSCRSLIKMLNRTGPGIDCWGTPHTTGCQVKPEPLTTYHLSLIIQPIV